MLRHILSGVIADAEVARLREFLDANAGQDVVVELNSTGGSPFAGLEAYHALRDHGRADVEVTGLAASAASLLAMGARKLKMKAGTLLMIHNSSAMTLGDADLHRGTATTLDKVDAQMISIYSARSKQSRAKIQALLDAETWMSPDEAVALRLADTAEAPSRESAARAAASIGDVSNLNPQKLAAALRASARSNSMPEVTNDPAVTPEATAANVQAILTSADAAGLTLKQTNRIIAESKGDVNAAKDMIIDAVHARSAAPATIPTDHVTNDAPETLIASVKAVLDAKMGLPTKIAGTPAEAIDGRSLLDIGAMLIQSNGGKIKSWNKDRLAQQIFAEAGAMSTSDLPFLTQESGNRVLAAGYEQAQSPLKQIARQHNSPDFRPVNIIRFSEAPELLEVPESSEVRYGARSDSKQAFSVKTYGRIFALTRQAIVNDDLGAFADTVRAWGQAAAQKEGDLLYSIIADDGVVMADNVAFWNAAHGNLADSGGGLDVASLSDARQAIRETRGLDGTTTRLNLQPQFLLVGPASETRAEQVLAVLAAAQVSEVNPFSGKLTLLVDSHIEDYAWMVFAAPSAAETIAYAYLNGRPAPELEMRSGWSVLGAEFRAIFDVGVGVAGYRGSFKNPGGDTE